MPYCMNTQPQSVPGAVFTWILGQEP
jgi:hypothetical protein